MESIIFTNLNKQMQWNTKNRNQLNNWIFTLGEGMSDKLELLRSTVDFDTSDGGLTFPSTTSKLYIKSIRNTIVNTYEIEISSINEH